MEERGIATWQNVDSPETKLYVEGYSVYDLWLPKAFMQSRILKHLPFMPNPEEKEHPRTLDSELNNITRGKFALIMIN